MPDSPPNADSPAAGHAGQDVVGRMAGEYRLTRKLGEGGFGAVYEAEHPLLRRRAAVKVLHQVAGMDSDAVLRFISEAQAANHIRSRHIVDVFSFGKLPNGRHFYVMDLLDGEPLDRFLRREKHCDVATTLQLLRPIAEALDAAHAAGVVHRDLKPQNLFLSWEASGETVPKLLDFGMAKLLSESAVQTVSGVPIGTPLYMSPEQARGEKVDGRSDVYALGVLCHEMLTGRVPFTGESPLAVLVSHLTLPAPRASEVLPELPGELDQPILDMLHKEPGGRPATAGAAIAALVAAAERAGIGVPAGMPHLPRPRELASSAPGTFSPRPFTSSGAGESPARAALVGSDTQPSPAARGPRWPFAGLLALAAVVAYLGRSVLQTSASPDASEPAPRAAGAAAPQGSAAAPSAAKAPAGAAASDAPANPANRSAGAAAGAAAPVAGASVIGASDGAPRAASSGASSGAAPAAVPSPAAPSPAAPSSAAGGPATSTTASASERQHVQLTLRGAPPGARVQHGGEELGEASKPLRLPFGKAPLELTVTAPGHEPQTLRVVPDHDAASEVKLRRRPARPKRSNEIPSDLESPF